MHVNSGYVCLVLLWQRPLTWGNGLWVAWVGALDLRVRLFAAPCLLWHDKPRVGRKDGRRHHCIVGYGKTQWADWRGYRAEDRSPVCLTPHSLSTDVHHIHIPQGPSLAKTGLHTKSQGDNVCVVWGDYSLPLLECLLLSTVYYIVNYSFSGTTQNHINITFHYNFSGYLCPYTQTKWRRQ